MGLTSRERVDLDQRLISASLELAAGKPLYNVLSKNRLTHFSLIKNLHRIPGFPELVKDKSKKKTLEGIAADPSRLLLIDEEYLRQEYEGVLKGQQSKVHSRSYLHLYNRQFIAYFAIVSTLPSAKVLLGEELCKDGRSLLVSEILGNRDGKPGIPINHRHFFEERRLNDLMTHHTATAPGSIESIWEMVDGYYMRKTGDASLFDQSKMKHLPDIEKTGWGRVAVLGDPDTMAARVYDILTKRAPEKIARKLSSLNRKIIIEGLDELASHVKSMVAYFRSIGLGGAMVAGFKGQNTNSPKAIYQALDHHYRKISKDRYSLFDTNQPDFSPLLDPLDALANKAYANKAIYEKLVRQNPQSGELALISGSDAARGIKKLPGKLTEHFRLQGFRKIIPHTYLEELPLAQAVLTGYSGHLRTMSKGTINLLDESRPDYISFDRRGTLIR